MKTIRRVDEMETQVREEAIIERTGNAMDKTVSQTITDLVLELVLESRERLEDGVEVVPRKVDIQEHLDIYRSRSDLVDGSDKFVDDEKGVGSRGAAQVCNG